MSKWIAFLETIDLGLISIALSARQKDIHITSWVKQSDYRMLV